MEAFPLSWPEGYTRSRYTQTSQFQTKFAVARDGLLNELRRMGAKHIVLSSNLELKQDGYPYANQKEPEDRGIAVYFLWKQEQYVFACDKWRTTADNVQAIRKSVEAMRGLDRWGVSEMLNRSFRGFKELPESTDISKKTWREILGLPSECVLEQAKAKYREMAKLHHSDKPGNMNHEYMIELNRAWGEAQAELEG